MMMHNFKFKEVLKCPMCGSWHGPYEGSWIQTEEPEDTKFLCLDCFEKYLEEEPE